jgi:hypothetical protein
MNREFFLATRHGDLARVQNMLADGDARITDANYFGYTALLHTAGDLNSFPILM